MTTHATPAESYVGLPWSYHITHDAESNAWIVTIDELPDFFAAGKTPGEAAGNGRDALLSHLSGYLATGTPIPTPTPKVTFWSHAGLWEPVAATA